MTAPRRRPRIEWAGLVAFALATLPMSAEAAGTECWGTWRFEVSPPTPDQEQMLEKDSWCRGPKLPRTVTAEARPGAGGRGILTGTPLRLLDIVKGGGRCEFQFAGPPAVAPRYYELAIDVNAAGAVVEGKARCADRTRESEDKSSGLSLELAVKGSHASAAAPATTPPAASAPAGVDRQAAAVAAACRQRDADALWKVMTPRFRAEIDARAAQVRQAAGSDLRRLFAYKGRPADFDGRAYLRATLKRDDPSMNMCWHAVDWKLRPAVAASGGYLVPVERHDVAGAFTFTTSDGGWLLDQMTKWTPVQRP